MKKSGLLERHVIRLRITKYGKNNIRLVAVKGIQHFGFGTFLCEIKPSEISCDQFSKDALLAAHALDGLNGLEVWADNRIAWGDSSHTIVIPLSEISKQKAADKWIKKIKV